MAAKVQCPNCGNDNLDMMTACDRPNAIRRVRRVEDDVLIVDAEFDIEYDGSEKTTLFCCHCNTDFESPIKIEYT